MRALAPAFARLALTHDPHAVREAWLCDVYKRFGDAWRNQTTGKPFDPRMPHAPGSARAKVAFERLRDEGGRAEGSAEGSVALPPADGWPLPQPRPPSPPSPPSPPVLHAVVVDLLGGVDAVEVVQGPLLGCWDPLPLHLQDCLPPLPLTPPRH